jgi:hypothetical protein
MDDNDNRLFGRDRPDRAGAEAIVSVDDQDPALCGQGLLRPKKFDTSGKSPAYFS